MRVNFLGTGNAFFSGGRAQSSILVKDREGQFLLECGVTTPYLLKKKGIDTASIDSILITHFHGDHFGGLAFLLLAAREAEQRKTALYLIGPPGLSSQVRSLLLALYPETDRDRWPFPLHYVEIAPGESRTVAGRHIQTFPADHMSAQYPALCVRIQTEGKVLAFTGDTGAGAPISELAKGADLLICECTLAQASANEQHLSPEEIIHLRPSLSAKMIALTHLTQASRLRCASIADVKVCDDGMELEIKPAES